MENNNYHLATKVVLLLIRLKIKFYITLFKPYFINKTTLVVANRNTHHVKPYYLIFK